MWSVPTKLRCAAEAMNAAAVICLGNRFVAGDDAGCRVFDHLTGSALPEGIELVDGGLCGLDLLRLVEGRRRVVFVDAVAGMARPGDIAVLGREQIAACAGSYGHGAGLPYLLQLLPQVCAAPLPEIALVGAEGSLDEAAIHALAQRAMEVARTFRENGTFPVGGGLPPSFSAGQRESQNLGGKPPPTGLGNIHEGSFRKLC
jgi:hydrogenase maturation protease